LLVLDLTLLNDSALNGLLDGFGLLRWLRYTLSGDIQFHVIVYTMDSSPTVDEQAKAWQVFAVIRKTETPQVLLRAIRQAFAAGKPKFSWIEAPTW
jgi:DNA-binding NarL/FixJ family response regulator